ncbi:MAG: nucleoside permease [Planctomycetes bacterium]|nr:nucleoside permease [Planctomycetota bacterium]
MQSNNRWRLFVMMALQFFIWGAWLPLIWGYMGGDVGKGGLGFSATQQAWIGSAFAIASIVAVFFSNQFADRKFAGEKFVAVSHLVGGLSLIGLWTVTDFGLFFGLMLVHSLFYVPTISVTNSIAFANLRDPQREFGLVRMGGTIGWIAAAWPLYFLLAGLGEAEAVAASRHIFLISAIASFVLAGFSLTLPHTPPKPATTTVDELAWVKALKLLGQPFMLVLFVVTFLDATIHNGYFKVTEGFLSAIGVEKQWVMPIMSIGQVAEILTMALLGAVLARLGWRTTMVLGILGHAARFGVFAYFGHSDHQAVIVAVQVLHGICYAFFFATVYIFVDAYFPKDVRTSAQGLFNLLILGLGDLAANWIFFPLRDSLTTKAMVDGKEVATVDYHSLFLVPTGMAAVAAVLLALAFRPPHAPAPAGARGSAAAH